MAAVALAAVAALAALWRHDDRDAYADPAAATPPPAPQSALPVPASVAELRAAPWNVHSTRNPENLSVVGDGAGGRAIRVSYPPGRHGAASGALLLANPLGMLPAEAVRLSYDVFFPPDFDFVIAGKLPGVALGTRPGAVAAGGNWKADAGSFRVMWQKPRGDAALIKGYAYLAIPGGVRAAYAPQGPSTKAAMNDDDRTGFSVWYKKQPGLSATRGAWNAVGMFVRLNTPGRADGVLELTVNGVTKRVDDVVWRTDAAVKIVDLYFVSFFGGGSSRFAPRRAQHALFRNVRVGPA